MANLIYFCIAIFALCQYFDAFVRSSPLSGSSSFFPDCPLAAMAQAGSLSADESSTEEKFSQCGEFTSESKYY